MKNKNGISLIVFVITIIVMIILATAAIVSLNSARVIDMANEAVDDTNLKQVQNIANMAWIEAYLDDKKTEDELKQAVKDAMKLNKVDTSKYKIEVTEQGVTVAIY